MYWIFLFYATIHFLPFTLSTNNLTVCRSVTSTLNQNSSEYTIALEESFEIKGQKGEKGQKGKNGTTGVRGEKGEKGESEKANETDITEIYSMIKGW